MEKFKRNFYTWITGHRKIVISLFLVLAIICGMMWTQVGVNYDIKDYLPEDSHSTISIEVMGEEYTEGVPNARVMIEDVSIPQALEYKERMEAVDGVDSVTWLDDSVNTSIPLSVMDDSLTEQYYNDGNALYLLTIDKEKILSAVPEVRAIVGDEAAMTGDAVSTEVATTSSLREIAKIAVMAVIVVFLLLVLATEAWIEPVIVLLSLGLAILINAGTNLIFGTVSFVTNGAGNVLLLAVSLDYSVFLLHRYHEYKEKLGDPREAMIEALCRSTSSIMSSGLTTVIGFLALVLMRFLLGPDLGLALAKGVLISLVTAFTFLPACILAANRFIEKTMHRPLMPSFKGLGKLVSKIMIPMACVFVLVVAPAYLASNANDYYYGAAKIFDSETKYGQDEEAITEVFGENDNYALMVQKGNLSAEKTFSHELQQLDEVTSVLSYVDSVGAEIPVEYLSEDIVSQLNSENYTRMVINAEVAAEGEETFALIKEIKALAEKYYPGEYYLAGAGPSNYDLMKTISADMLKVNLVAIAAVYLVLAIMLRSVLLPVLLVLSIETAIWINLSVPYFTDTTIFYISYLIISAIQLGATVDYAILVTDRYRECRETLNKKDAVVETIASSVPSILVSGLALTTAGLLMGQFSTNGILAMLGTFLGRGALLSLFIVIFVLPGLLYIFDKLYINRGKGKMDKKKITAAITAFVMLGAVMMPATASAAANSKEEVIYGNLGYDGSLESVYAVNIFDNKDVSDCGDYSEVKNLTTEDEIKIDGEKITVEASETPFYYEGTMVNQTLPWDIEIDYRLDGKKCDAQELAGKSGFVEIHMTVKEGSDSFFYDNYALQISMTLDRTFCRNIVAEGATIANVGSDKQLTYTVLPGRGADVTVTADVTAFEMSEISINGIKLEMDVDVNTSELESKAQEIEEGTVQLDEGAGELNKGATDLMDAVSQINDGAGQLDEGITELQTGTGSLEKGAVALQNGIAQFGGGMTDLYTGASALVEGVNSTAYTAVLAENGLDVAALTRGNDAVATQLTQMVQQAGAAMDPQQQALYQQIITLLQGNNAAINGAMNYIDGVNGQLSDLLAAISQLNSGTADLEEGAKTLVAGTEQLNEGAGKLQTGSSTLSDGTAELAAGSEILADGTSDLKEGTAAFRQEAEGIDEQVSEEIDSMKESITGSDEVRSFVSDKNTNVESVQFVLKTKPISVSEVERAVEEEPELNFFQKLIALFK